MGSNSKNNNADGGETDALTGSPVSETEKKTDTHQGAEKIKIPSDANAQGKSGFFADAKAESRFFVIVKVLSRIETSLLIFGVLFYFISGTISWKFETSGAEKLINIIGVNLKSYRGKVLTNTELDKLDSTLNQALKTDHFAPVFISNFAEKATLRNKFTGKNDTIDNEFSATAPAVRPDEFTDLKEISSWSRSKITELVINKLDTVNYSRLNLDQFITQGAFSYQAQVNILKLLFFLLSAILITNGVYYYHQISLQKRKLEREHALQKTADDKTNKEASPVWELAQLTLDKYYTRNLSQNNWIFYVSVVVMAAGFILVLYGISVSYSSPNNKMITYVSAGSGVIVQFIGGTFLVIYNSTISQAIQYTASLQKVSSVGTSIKILDSIRNDVADDKKTTDKYVDAMMAAKIELAKLLIEQSKK